MSKFKIILTSDYEVWGDGSGCVEQCVIKPTSQILNIANKYKAPVTFFFDVCEYWAFEQIEKRGDFENDYRPATMMKRQLQEAIKHNHDVQLHFHPQWLSYQFISNQLWKLDFRYWRLSKVNDFHNSDWDLEKLFIKGKETLEEMFSRIKSDYIVNAFRAGAWCIQPEKEVIKAMKSAGISVDSTVAPGLRFDDGMTVYNFTNSPVIQPYWRFSDNVQTLDANGQIIEVPISTVKVTLIRRLYYLVLKILLNIRRTPEKCTQLKGEINRAGYKKIESIKKLIGSSHRMLNFSDATSAQEMIYLCKTIMKNYGNSELEEIPIVVISHPKTFGNPEHFERFMKWLNQNEKVSFGTFQELLKQGFK